MRSESKIRGRSKGREGREEGGGGGEEEEEEEKRSVCFLSRKGSLYSAATIIPLLLSLHKTRLTYLLVHRL
jgi:hypothetical protein